MKLALYRDAVVSVLFRYLLAVRLFCLRRNNTVCSVPAGDKGQTAGGSGTAI